MVRVITSALQLKRKSMTPMFEVGSYVAKRKQIAQALLEAES